MSAELIALSPEEEVMVVAVLARYDLPAGPRTLLRNMVGFVNKTYVIDIAGDKFVLRRSSPETSREHLDFESEIFRYLTESGFALSPRLIANAEGVCVTELDGAWMLQAFMPGEIRANWNDTAHFEGEMLRDFFRASARFTKAASGFRSFRPYVGRTLPYYAKSAKRHFEEIIEALEDSPGRTLLIERFDALCALAERASGEFERLGWERLPQQLVHFDFHPGNVRYEGDKVVGIFDYDWALMDNRIADLASTISQSCWTVDGPDSGMYAKEKMAEGLAAYREVYGESEFSFEKERALLTAALEAYLLFQLLWSARYYLAHHKDGETDKVIRLRADACLRNDFIALLS